MIKTAIAFAATGVLAAACASYPAPNDHLATSMASLRSAQEIGAKGQTPDAALHIRLAQEEVDRAKQLVADGDNERADYETMRANGDAQLAIALIRENDAKAKANQAVAKVQELSSQTMTTGATLPGAAPRSPASSMTPTTNSPTSPMDTTPTPATKSPR